MFNLVEEIVTEHLAEAVAWLCIIITISFAFSFAWFRPVQAAGYRRILAFRGIWEDAKSSVESWRMIFLFAFGIVANRTITIRWLILAVNTSLSVFAAVEIYKMSKKYGHRSDGAGQGGGAGGGGDLNRPCVFI